MAFPTTAVIDGMGGTNGQSLTTYNATVWNAPTNLTELEIQDSAATAITDNANNGNITDTTYGDDQECFVTLSTKPADSRVILLGVRMTEVGDIATTDGWCARYATASGAGNDSFTIEELINGALTNRGGANTQELSSGDKIGIEIISTTVRILYDTGGGWTESDSYTDAGVTVENGNLLLFCSSTTARLDDFGGGTVVTSGLGIPIASYHLNHNAGSNL